MKTPLTGGCACGAIRYEITDDPIVMLKCHCRDCQRLTGGPYSPAIYVARHAFKVTQGAIRHHFTKSERGHAHQRGFCPECGSRISGAESERGIAVTAGTLDDPSFFRPQMNLWTEDAAPWDVMEKDLPAFPRYAPT
jgi:hypothetical protein